MVFDKFKKISSNILEYMLENETKLKPEDNITDKVYKLTTKFDFYKDKKNFEKLDKTVEEVVYHFSTHTESLKATKNEVDYFVRDPMIVENMKESLILLAAKEDKQLAYDFITKYQPVVGQTTIMKTIDNDNLTALEMLLINPATRFNKSREDVVDAKMIIDFACEQKKMDFLKFGVSLSDNSEIFYADALRYTVNNNYAEGIKYVAGNFKDKIPTKYVEELAKDCITAKRFDTAEVLKQVFPESNIVVPNGVIEQKIKEIREKNSTQVNTKNVLKS